MSSKKKRPSTGQRTAVERKGMSSAKERRRPSEKQVVLRLVIDEVMLGAVLTTLREIDEVMVVTSALNGPAFDEQGRCEFWMSISADQLQSA